MADKREQAIEAVFEILHGDRRWSEEVYDTIAEVYEVDDLEDGITTDSHRFTTSILRAACQRAVSEWVWADADVGKSLGCCDCEGEFENGPQQDRHAAFTGHNVEG